MNNKKIILVTGGLGFIGSHVVVKLLGLDKNIVILDNLSNSDISILNKIITITDKASNINFIEGDIRDKNILNEIFQNYNIHVVMHFAALKSVNESQKYPTMYHNVNVKGTQIILEIMNTHNCKNFVYSSSATVYGDSPPPVTENSPVGTNLACNYARNKYNVEQYLIKNFNSGTYKGWNIIILRYFNPIGAHPSGIIGEDPHDIPNNVFPYLLRVAKWTNTDAEMRDNDSPYSIFTVFGNDYDTRDGTCIRDYIHVQDLARAHVDALKLIDEDNNNLKIYNVGTGQGSTVLELVNTLNDALEARGKLKINYTIGNRRAGDLDVSYAIVNKIYEEIGFKTKLNISNMCHDGLNFISDL